MMQKIKDSLSDLNALVLQGRALEAFEKYYHEDVMMQENNQPPTIGKNANRKREEVFFGNVTEFRSADVISMAVGDDVSYVTWKYDYTHKEWGVRDYTQVSVQKWKDGKIIHEQFFYSN
jgi:ketosteroid isomerase-like protein